MSTRPPRPGDLATQLPNGHQIELFVVKLGVRTQRDVTPERLLQVLEHRTLLVSKRARDVGIDPQHEALPIQITADLLYFRENLVTDRRRRLAHAPRRAL